MKKIAPICIMVLMLIVFAVHCARWCQEQSSPPTNTTSGEEEVTTEVNKSISAIEASPMNMDFIIADGDSLKIYNGTYSYARVHTDKPIGHEKLKRICTALCKKGEPRIIYFHSDNKCGRGDEYACYQDQTLFDYRIKETEKAIIHL